MKLSQLVGEVVSRDETITMTRNGRQVAVLVSPDECDSWQETLAIRGDAELLVDIRRGLENLKHPQRLSTLEELFTECVRRRGVAIS